MVWLVFPKAPVQPELSLPTGAGSMWGCLLAAVRPHRLEMPQKCC